ncbi:MAG: NAD(P)/FAD-dependent oxidoreductase [Parasphingorhabdus sp.]|uniref:FAD-dependent oxidoreductase n=1 Tax=Parasphingorhabdus sp. TaxID=2709688 RepID=UPI0032987856
MRHLKTQVVIAGAGPVGSVAAYYLAMNGIDVILLESGVDCALDLRASTFHPPTLEMLDQFGITEKLIARGLKAPIYHFRERKTGEVIDFDMTEIADETRFPYRIQCEQYHLSRMLSEAVLAQPGADVKFSHRLVGFNQDQDGVDIYAESPTDILQIRADFLIGADGSNSIVRKWLDVDFDGFTYPEKFLCYTTEERLEDKLPNLCHVNYVSDPNEWMVLLKVPSLWRVLVPAKEEQPDAELLADHKKNDVFDRLLGDGAGVATEHRTIYRVHQRVAKKFVHDRVSIIGDAAHLNNPIGGFGMNSGIHDAFNLCDKLVRIYNDAADADSMLGLFERQRHKTTHDFIQAQTIRNMEYLSEGEDGVHDKRKEEMMRLHDDPEARRGFLLRQSMIESLELEKAVA